MQEPEAVHGVHLTDWDANGQRYQHAGAGCLKVGVLLFEMLEGIPGFHRVFGWGKVDLASPG